MNTIHRIFFRNASDMSEIAPNSIDLVITSPPYPMIEMWDPLFCAQNLEIKRALEIGDGRKAFLLMHRELSTVWEECLRVLKEGGIACINIGDATRKIKESFQLYPNHVLVANYFQKNGFISLPSILWRKPTNAPNKFMGSGMLPPNAYVTLEHEHILIFRKGNEIPRFPPKSTKRYNSAYFWEERNNWFSDVWSDFRGTMQSLTEGVNGDHIKLRERSGAFPLELPYRLINMYSVHGDTILDPFWGTGTTTIAAMICGRNSIGYEVNSEFRRIFKSRIRGLTLLNKNVNEDRLTAHKNFVKQQEKQGRNLKYRSTHYGFKVTTNQEKKILLYFVDKINPIDNVFKLTHVPFYLDHH